MSDVTVLVIQNNEDGSVTLTNAPDTNEDTSTPDTSEDTNISAGMQFLETLKSILPDYYTGNGETVYENYISQISNTPTDKVDTSPFTNTIEFLCVLIEIVSTLNGLGLTGDSIQQKNFQTQKITTTRVLYTDEFPPERYAYAPVKLETKTIFYSDSGDEGITSNEIEANKIIASLYGTQIPEQVKEVQITVSDYDISPPVAILKNESKSSIQTVLIAPNMDANWISIHQFSKFVYYVLSSFQPAILEHALAYFFIKNYSYEESLILNALSSSQAFIATLCETLKASKNDKEFLKNTFTAMYDLVTGVSDLLNGVVASIANVTGNKSRVDPKNTLMLLASILENDSIIEMLQDSKEIYESLKSKIPSGKVEDIVVQSTHISYTPQGEQTIVEEKTVQLTAHGQRCSYVNTRKISRNSSIQIIPLLRSKVTSKNGSLVNIEVGEEGQAKLLDENKLGVTGTKTLFVSLPTTSWDDAMKISATLSNLKYVSENVSFRVCFNSLTELFDAISKFNIVSFSYNNNSKIASIRVSNRGFEF